MALVRLRWPIIVDDAGNFFGIEGYTDDEWFEVDCTSVSICGHEVSICPVCLKTWYAENNVILVDRNNPSDYTDLDAEIVAEYRRHGVPETSMQEILDTWFAE